MVKDVIDFLIQQDPQVGNAVKAEYDRQRRNIELIASENFVSEAVLAAASSVLTNKYAEGYPGKRYYGGCECVDVVENIARDRAKALFGADHVNVQPHSGASANYAVYQALCNVGDTVLGMNLDNGGHLTHGSPVNFSGLNYNIVPYGVDPKTHRIRITGLLGLTDGTKDPGKVEKQLRACLPPEESNDFCHRLVLHGRAVCRARKPDCPNCVLRPWCDHFQNTQEG